MGNTQLGIVGLKSWKQKISVICLLGCQSVSKTKKCVERRKRKGYLVWGLNLNNNTQDGNNGLAKFKCSYLNVRPQFRSYKNWGKYSNETRGSKRTYFVTKIHLLSNVFIELF